MLLGRKGNTTYRPSNKQVPVTFLVVEALTQAIKSFLQEISTKSCTIEVFYPPVGYLLTYYEADGWVTLADIIDDICQEIREGVAPQLIIYRLMVVRIF